MSRRQPQLRPCHLRYPPSRFILSPCSRVIDTTRTTPPCERAAAGNGWRKFRSPILGGRSDGFSQHPPLFGQPDSIRQLLEEFRKRRFAIIIVSIRSQAHAVDLASSRNERPLEHPL